MDIEEVRQTEHRFTVLETGQRALQETTDRIEAKIDKFVTTADERYLAVKDCGGVCRAPQPGTWGAIAGRVAALLGVGTIGAGAMFVVSHWTEILGMLK